MPYIYQASLWCDECGERLKAEQRARGLEPKNPEDEHTFDSDDYPKFVSGDEESDSPNNCASGDCAGNYGTFLENSLTQDGYKYVKEMLDKHGPTLPEPAKEWAEFYNFAYHTQEWSNAHEWLQSKTQDTYLFDLLDSIDGDTIQDRFQSEMEEDGYFKAPGWYSSEMVD
jgi:hypothetical protein